MSYYTPLSRRLSEYAASYLSPYIKLDDDGYADGDTEGNDASVSASKPPTQSSLSVGLWSGNVELKNVDLRPDAIENFLNADYNNSTSKAADNDVNDSDGNNISGARVRWKLLRGSIESIKIRIPWKSLVVGSSHSSTKRSSEKMSRDTLSSFSESEGGGRDVDAGCGQINSNHGEEEAEIATDGCTVVTIEGVRLQIGYEVIHEDREKNDRDDQNSPEQDPCSNPQLGDARKKIRAERDRILQISERRLLAGLDPFPPSLLAGLQSIIASSIQSGVKSESSSTSSSSDTVPSTNRRGSYFARMEDYLSSTMRNIVWRTFDSLSLSITHVHMSMVGCSHYDKDAEATLRKSIAQRKQHEKEKEEEQAQKQKAFKDRWGNFHQTTPKIRNTAKRIRQNEPFSTFHTSAHLVPEELEIEANKTQQRLEGGEQVATGEDASWANEGEIEIGFLLDRFDVRPASLDESLGTENESVTSADISAISDKDQSALKHFRISNLGVFLRRRCKQCGEDEPSFSNDLKNDDFIIDPTNIAASVRWYRSNPEAGVMSVTETTSTTLSPHKRRRGQSFSISTDLTSESIGTSGTKRRGKRDKKPLARLSQTYQLRKRSRRLELSVHFGHVRSSVSSRQLFLLDSVCSSLDRLKRGRPSTTIRSAMTFDKELIKRMAEEGMPIIDWDERIIKAIPSLRSSRSPKSPRTLPTVIASWWKYAYISIMHENKRRRMLLDRCSGINQQQTITRNNLAWDLKSTSNWDFENQSKIRKDYIELYLETQTSSNLAAKIRLEELEDQLSVERILLLRNVARAASIRRNDYDSKSDGANSLDVSASNDEYFYFPPNFLNAGVASSKYGEERHSLDYSTLSNDRYIAGGVNSTTAPVQVESRHISKSTTRPSQNDALSDLTELPRSTKTFFVSVKISGFSLALCNFGEDERGSREESEEKFNVPDDISALTGFSEADDASVGRIKVQQLPDERLPADNFVPSCQFWTNSRRGLYYEPIMLMHIVGISVSGQNVDGDHSRVECEFAVGGLDVVSCASPSPKRIISLGQWPIEEQIGDELICPLPFMSQPSESIGICGIASFGSGAGKKQSSSIATNISPTTVMVDWAGLEKVTVFVTESKDISKGTILLPLQDEALLRNAFAAKPPSSNLSLELECNKLSLVIPTPREDSNDEEGQYIIATAESFSLKTGLAAKANEKTRGESLPTCNEAGRHVTLNDLSICILTGEFDPFAIETSSTALLQNPLNIQLHFISSGGAKMPYESKTEIKCTSHMNFLVSDYRLQVLSRLVAMCSSYLSKDCDKSDGENELLRPTLPTIADSVLTETKLSIPSLVISLVSENEDNNAMRYSEFLRCEVEEIMTNYLSQLSCLDFTYPSQISSECMTKLCLGRCSAVGLSKHDAQILLHTAESHFKDDIAVIRIWDEKYVSQRVEVAIATAVKKAVSKFDTMQRVHSSIWHPESKLVLFVKSLTISQSRLFLASLLQCTSGEVCVQNNSTTLLRIASSGDENITFESPDVSTTISIKNCRDEFVSSDVYLELGHIDAVFLAEAYIEAAETLQSTTRCFGGTKKDVNDTPFKDLRFNGNASSASILLTDKLIPFLRCRLGEISIEKVSGPRSPLSKMVFLSESLAIECVSPYGAETYPDVITTYQSSDNSGFGPSALTILMTSVQSAPSSEQARISITLERVRVLVLYQFICELTQFISSPKYGFGLLSQYFCNLKEKSKGENTSSATSKMEIIVRNSSLVLPRESTSVDLIGIEVEELSISPCKAEKSWSIDQYSFSNRSGLNGDERSSSSSSEGFFECMEVMKSPGIIPLNNVDQHAEDRRIPRLRVQLKNARIFTAIIKHCKSVSEIHMPRWNACVLQTGRIQSEKRAFRACGVIDESIASNIECRLWEEITTMPLSLGLTIDWVPKLRLLIENTQSGESIGVGFDMRMSQFYLLMSIWYNNMDELPLLFPYDAEQIQTLSIDPEPPLDWPEYGSKDFIERIKHGSACIEFEMAICVSSIAWRCSFDQTNYFGEGIDPETFPIMQSSASGVNGKAAIVIELENALCSIKTTEETLLSVGLGATSMNLTDERCPEATLSQGIRTKNSYPRESFMDFNWGLDCGRHTLVDGLPLPVQASVFMTPDYFCMINLGLASPEAVSSDLGVIWILLDYFGLYFKDPNYGHPVFVAEKMAENHLVNVSQAPCLDIDFRLWLTDPHVIIPTSSNVDEICLMLESAGLHYRYKSFGLHFSSQDILAKDLGIVVLSTYIEADLSRGTRQVSGSLSSSGAKTLVDGLSFSVKYEYDDRSKFTRFAVRVPLSSQYFNRNAMEGIEPFDLDAKPVVVPPPLICNPLVLPSRNLGENETTMYFSYEYMKLAVELLIAFVGPNLSNDDETTEIEKEETINTSPSGDLFSVTAHLESIKFVVSDPIMGMHRPFFSLSISSILLTASRLKEMERDKKKHDKFLGRDDAVSSSSSNDEDLQACMDATIFLDYFKLGITRNWEPLVEPFRCMTMFEQSTTRGKGIIFDAACPLHLNITGASIDTIDDAIDTLGISFLEKNYEKAAKDVPPNRSRPQIIATTVSRDESGHKLTVLHKSPETLTEQERIAFSLKNFSGQRIRVHTQSDLEAELSSSKTTVIYLDHNQLMPVSFPATETVIKNLEPVEVPFKGDQNITAHKKQLIVPRNHSIDIQVPGFKWARDISLDKMGKHFIELTPRSPFVQAKASADWRLKNALHILAEVNSVNGGRRLCITSPFEVVNKTDHSIFIAINPDPRHLPKGETLESKRNDFQDSVSGNIINDVEKLDPDDSYNVPYLLLESAMHLEGNHLGSIWVRPDQASCEETGELSSKDRSSQYFSDTDTVGYPPRPVQLAKILHESSVIFRDSNGDPRLANQVASGAEISCPILDCNKKRKTTPFCYVVEVKRSPLISSETPDDKVADIASASSPPMGKGLLAARTIFSKTSMPSRATTHAPVAYSLVIHPPIVIENLLPERGRFELMNATNKAVLWWGILEPGERFPIHTVGLDAPLMLLVNLGFCRTPVGEGALIHDGEGDGFWLKSGWRTVGSAISGTQDKVKKTLSSITKSKDNRGAERVTKLRQKSRLRETKKRRQSPRHSATNALGEDVENERSLNQNMADAKLRDTFSADDIATETTVVDSVGQRLTLLLDNVFGNGGQRHVTIYSPFWIVNTTEHSLRYKQEKALSYVSGTVWGAEKDGSKPVDGSNRNENDDMVDVSAIRNGGGLNSLKLNTVFSGTHGALKELEKIDNEASKPAILAALISEDLPLSITSKLAFMFNFQVSSLGGSPRMCIQLADKTKTSCYTSAWSSGFGLESVGVTQIVGMLCKDGRGLEVMVSISVAPGRLSSYTKIVRICPRYVVVNQLPQSIRLWQDNSLLHSNQVTESSDVPFESRKWIFVDGSEKGVINQYEPLFGAPTMIDSTDEMGLQSNAHHSARYIATIRPSELIAFHLPDTRLERLLRVEVGSGWNLSSSFPSDTPGQHVLSMDRARDIQALPHVSTRAAPYYNVVLPPPDGGWNGELGVWFETDWGKDRAIIVKGTRDGSYASHFTDIVVGDELVSIDDVPIKQLTFAEAMKHLKARLSYAQELNESEASQPLQQRLNKSLHRKRKHKKMNSDLTATKKESVTLTFVTLEEKMRRLRSAAASTETNTKSSRRLQVKGPNDSDSISAGIIEGNIVPGQSDINILPHESSKDILVDTNFLYQTILVNVKEPDLSDPLHKIINRSSSWDIYYRQRACDCHPWKCLSPGESASYTWEEPMKPKKLSVRVGPGEWDGRDNCSTAGTIERKKRRPIFSVHFVENEEQGHFGATKTVKLEEIGYMDKLPCPAKGEGGKTSTDGLDGGLHCYVDTEGATRVLIISDEVTQSLGGDESLLVSHLTNIKKQLREENKTKTMIDLVRASISDTGDGNTEFMDDSIAKKDLLSKLNDIVDYDEGLFITEPNQVIVEVLEAAGLQSVHLSGLSNPYCQVSLIEGRKKMQAFSFGSKVQSRSTYYVEKSLNPQWSRQAFVFDVPSKAANDPRETRRFSIHCVVRSEEKFGPAKFLGQAHVHLRNLEDQQECVGWYPLMGNVGRNEDSVDRIRGAIRLRVHWVFDYPGLLNYYSLCSDRRIETLQKSKAGMKRQLKTLKEDEKQRKENRESLSLSKVPALAATMYRKKKTQLMEPVGERRKSVVIKGIKRVVNAKSALVQFRLSKADRTQSDLSGGNENDFEGVLDEINEECASDNSDDSFESLQRIPTSFSGLTSPLKEVHTLDSIESENNDLLSISAANEDLSSSLLKGCLDSRLQYLRHSNRGRKNKHTVQIHGTPVFASLHISRAFINAGAHKNTSNIRETPEKLSPTMLGNDDDIEEDNKYHHIIDHLRLPSAAPLAVSKRGQLHIRDLMHSRTSFSKAARRSLGSILNPGGVLIIRPITALNLPETYTSMFVKLRCGNKMCQTNKADSTVAPVWSDEETVDLSTISSNREHSQGSARKIFEKQDSYKESDNDLNEIAEWFTPTRYWGTPKQNDLIINVDAFETSKSLHLTVIGEKLQAKEVIGVLEIPLEKAIECCSQSMEDFQESLNEGNTYDLTPAYVRWFPLKSSALAVPVEGDMGQSTRPPDSEKVNDNMFEEYFAPCIKLALLFQPNQTERTNTDQYIFTRLDRISAAVIDSSRFNELLSFSSRDVDIRISVTKAKTRTSLTVGNVQIDQQSSNFRYKAPVIFAPTPTKYPHPTVQFLCWKDNVRSKSDMDSYEYVALRLEEMDLKIEEMWLFEVWEFYFHVVKKREARALARQKIVHTRSSRRFEEEGGLERAIQNATSFLQVDREVKRLKKIYVCKLLFGYTKINLSYFKSAKGNLSSSDTSEDMQISSGNQVGLEAFRQWSEDTDGDADERSHFAHVNMISTVFPSISDAPIKFQGKVIEHVFEYEGDISKYLLSFYASEALRQIYKIVGSLDFVGNPTMVVSSFSTGLRDFVLQPSRELKHLTKNPSRFGVGVLRGTLSLVSNSASGVFGLFSNIGSSFGATAAILTLDKEFQNLHAEQQVAQQRNYDRLRQRGFGRVTLLVTRPVHDVVFGLVSASTGLITEPYRGAKREGIKGFAKGTGVGVIGVVAKPVVGLSDAFAHVMESVHDLAKDMNVLEWKYRSAEKYRLPYVFGVERILVPFSQVDSISAALLKAHPVDKKSHVKGDDEVIVTSEALQIFSGLDQYIIVTTKRVVLFKVKVSDGQGFATVNLVWQALLGEGARITSNLGDRGHNSSILCISRFYCDDTNDDVHSTFDESEQVDLNEIPLRSRSVRSETPKQYSGVPFRRRSARPFGSTDGVVVNRYVVDGEFKQRPNLIRIHNAICCLAGDFDSTIDEGYSNGRGDGVTVFGPLLFMDQPNAPKKANLAHLYKSLEHAAWECYSKEQEIAPLWLDEAHILRTFTSPPPRTLLIHREDPALHRKNMFGQKEFLSNSIDVDKANGREGEETSLSEENDLGVPQRDSFNGAAPFNLNDIFIDDDNGFENEEIVEEHHVKSFLERPKTKDEGTSRSDSIFKSARSHHNIFDEREQLIGTPSIEAISLRSWTTSPSATGEQTDDLKGLGLNERLSRVESALERLSQNESVVSGSIATKPMSLIGNTFSISHSENEYPIHSNFDVASTTSSIGKLSNRDAEVESLQREIMSLKQQLNSKKLETVVEGTSTQVGHSGSMSSYPQQRQAKPKLKERMKQLIGKKKS